MSSDSLICANCRGILPVWVLNRPENMACPACGTDVQIQVFPAAFRKFEAGSSGQRLLIDSESSCFYHAEKRAEVVCDTCGRFLCGLCDIELAGRHICPACINSSGKIAPAGELQSRRTSYDSIALLLALVPFCIPYIVIFTAPAVLLLAYLHFRASKGPQPRRMSIVLAAVTIAGIELVAIAVVVAIMIAGIIAGTGG